MDNRRIIDADKLLEWLGEIIKAHIMFGQNERVYAYKDVKKRIMSGAFAPDPIPPTIKPGDKVRFKRSSNYGLGEVKGIDAFVKFPELTMTIRVNPDDLEVISHD